MNEPVEVIVCAAGAAWELPLVRGFQSGELGIRVSRRCVDYGELLGTALRDRPRAIVVDASLPWIDRDFVTTMRRAEIEVLAIGASARPLGRIGVHCLSRDATADAVAVAVFGLGQRAGSGDDGTAPGGVTAGRIVAVWGGAGSPGRTVCAVHVAVEAARSGVRTLVIDGDVWAASVAQLLGLDESPSLAVAARLAGDGWSQPFATCVQAGPDGVHVLAGLARSELWPEVRDAVWRAVLAAAVVDYDLVVVDLAAPIEEDEELVFDRAPYRRNLVTTAALELSDEVLLVAAADPVGLRRAVVAHRTFAARWPEKSERVRVVLNRAPRAGARLQDCSASVSKWIGLAPVALLPSEPALGRVGWEGRPLQHVAPRSRWLRELRPVLDGVLR